MSANLYLLPDSPWMDLAAAIWAVVAGIAAITFLVIVARQRRNIARTVVVGLLAVGLIIGGFVVQIGPSVAPDSEGRWYCPMGINAIQITEAPGRSLPQGIRECRTEAKRNVAIGLIMAAAGAAVTTGAAVHALRRRTRCLAPSDREGHLKDRR
ncbi:hypothetical protein [Brevibacterium oceani]|uniref:hypothetical protein n=1 Tax=Brevibacterium oceani TaxID=358099 RepID=UPI001B323E7D|nr:hypothetical protein [Brevibacterium oceani]